MFGVRTPAKKATNSRESPDVDERAGPSTAPTQPSSVRRSIGEWEASKTAKFSPNSPRKTAPLAQTRPKLGAAVVESKPRRVSAEAQIGSQKEYPDRVAEARACIRRAKTALGESRNLRADIKADVTHAVERLFQLVKEAEIAKLTPKSTEKEIEKTHTKPTVQEENSERQHGHLTQILEEHAKLLLENNLKMEELKNELEAGRQIVENRATYARVAATAPKNVIPEHTSLHSIVVASTDHSETGDEVIEKIRKAVNAKDGFVTVDRVRKARDRKVIVGCRTQEERQKVKERLSVGGNLVVEEVKNKDPLLALKNVFTYNTDEDIIRALRKQNGDLFQDLKSEDDRVEIAFKRKNRNPHTNHVILRVSPQLWNRTLHKGAIHIDIQRIKVEDQSPLVQCTCCLAYGHSKRFCKETIEKCSHCGGPHTRAQCPDWLAGAIPSCVNCVQAKHASTEHNAFSNECAVRRRWEAMARARVAYC